MPSNTPTPPRASRVERDITPELRSSRSQSHRAPTEDPTDARSDSHRSSHRRSTRDYTPDADEEAEEEDARRRRRRRERERAEEDEISDPDERRRRRAERKERERLEEEELAGSGRGEKRRRDRSRESHRSRGSGGRDRERERERPTREDREREREDRDRLMRQERRERDEYHSRGGRDRRDDRSPPRRRARQSPSYDRGPPRREEARADALLKEIDSEARSVFVSQLAAKLTSRDLGMFFEHKLGEGAVRDAKVVTDRVSKRSKGIGYVELDALELVEKAIAISGTIVMGLPILVELTEAERNKQAPGGGPPTGMPGFGPMDPHAPMVGPGSLPPLTMQATPMHAGLARPNQLVPPGQLHRDRFAGAEIPYHRLYVGSLHFDLTADDVKQVFAPFGEIEFVDLHRDSMTGKSKGFCFVQYLELESAKTALQTMNGFELAGRQLRVSTVNEKAGNPGAGQPARAFNGAGGGGFGPAAGGGPGPQESGRPESLEEHHGQKLDHATRQSLMQKLARQDGGAPPAPMMAAAPPIQDRPNIPAQPSLYVLVSNVFNPAEETERDWDLDLAEDIKGEVESKYGPVLQIKVEKESQGEVYIKFDTLESSGKAVAGLNGRFFGGRSLVAHYLPEIMFKAHF